jgi:hypothetical protein
MSDWWNKKLSGQEPTPQRTYATPPTSPPLRFPAPSQSAPTAPQSHSTVPSAPQDRQDVLDPSKAPTEQITMGDAIRLWKGGEAMRKEGNLTCPECGSIHVFSRTGRGFGTTVNGASPAPRCYECGWNGMYDQGSRGNWV